MKQWLIRLPVVVGENTNNGGKIQNSSSYTTPNT